MTQAYQVIRGLLRTEKGSAVAPYRQYLFLVDPQANKIQIRKALEEIYKVKVQQVNTVRVQGKLKRVRFHYGRRPEWKKAFVTLKVGHKIEVA